MRFTLRQLAYFQALAATRSFGAAAERMHVTQPALSMQIKELEAAMGGALVDRLPREVRLTPRGRAVLTQAARILGEARELDAFARRGVPDEQINLGMIPTVAPYLLPLVLERVGAGQAVPGLRVREAQTGALVAALVDGQLDAVLIAGPLRDPRMVAAALFEDRFLLAAQAQRLARLGVVLPALHPEDLDPEQLLLLDEGHCLADQALAVCGLDRRFLRVDLGATSLGTLCRLVAADHGLTLLPEIAVEAELGAAQDLALRRFAPPEPGRQLMLARRAGTAAEGWFPALAELLAETGTALVARARERVRA